MNDGWILVSRSLLHSRHRWHPHSSGDPACRAFAWIDLIGLAAFDGSGGLDRGQVRASTRYLAARWNWSRNKVLRFLSELESEGSIRRDHERSREPDRISICNYERYQDPRSHERDHERIARDTANGAKEERRKKKEEMFGSKLPGNPVVENSKNGTAQDGETWNERLAPLARRAGGEKHIARWLAWCKNSLLTGVSVEQLEARIGGLCELRDKGVFGEWIEKGVPMTPAIFERTPQLRQECDSAWIKYGPNRSGDIVKRLGVTL